MKKIIIAIDGFSGCGKSSTAKAVASKLNYLYLDSGSMYRAVTYNFQKHHINLDDQDAVKETLEETEVSFSRPDNQREPSVVLNGEVLENQIRTMEVSQEVSKVAAIAEVRKKMVEQQRAIGRAGEIVMDGRDIGSVVFPQAELKIFMRADLDVRAQRRYKEFQEKGIKADLSQIRENLAERDRVDTTRKISPLLKAADAIDLDTSNLTFDQQVDFIINLAKEKICQE
jgi:cytidylate kinase